MAGSAEDLWDGSVAPGGWTCSTCGVPTESEPCPEHQDANAHHVRAVIELWSRDRLDEHKMRRVVRVNWPELAKVLDDLLDASEVTV